MRTTSTYIPSDRDTLLLEFEYNSKVISTRDSSFLRIKNAYTGSINYLSFNPLDYSKPEKLTNNILDKTVQQVDDNKWIHFDIDRPIRYFEQKNSGILFESLYHDISQEIIVTYHSLKIHLLSGYVFDDYAGLIARVAYIDQNSNQTFVANFAYLKGDDVQYHPRPFRLGDRVYDRYIEIKFPTLQSLKDVDSQISPELKVNDKSFYINGAFPDTQKSRINIFLYDINHTETDSEGQFVLSTILPMQTDTNGLFKRELEIIDSFADISAQVQESEQGDYFELFPMYQGQFIQDFLNYRKQIFNEDYLVIHDIEVYEQLFDISGYSETQTQAFSQIQDSGFENPYKFRPVVENDAAIAFTIQYTLRLFNKTDPSHIIRRASLTFKNPKKYGRFLDKLDIPVGFQPMRIVNKLLKTTNVSNLLTNSYNIASVNKTLSTEVQKNVFIPFQLLNISINAKTLYLATRDSNDPLAMTSKLILNNLIDSEVVYGQGDGLIFLNKFDNFLKFKIYKEDNDRLIPYVDIVNSQDVYLYLVFEDDSGSKIRVGSYYSDNALLKTELQPGEILFKIVSSSATNILNYKNKKFWITIENKVTSTNKILQDVKDFETILYTGTFASIDDYKSNMDQDYVSKYALLNSKLSEYQSYVNEIAALEDKINALVKNVDVTNMQSNQKSLMDNYLTEIKTIMDKAMGK